jgi:long-chain acyl-CoA synthetase
MAGVTDPLNWTLDAIGDIPGSIEMKLIDFEEAGYLSTNNPPQGEICIRGDSVMEGYFGNPEETAQYLSADGWYKTGDIGEFDRNGHIRIIDRKKSLVKSLNAEYIGLEKV